ncbi:MAG TPA: DUF3786 domain-containing protein [Desulfotomaculum sp.]|nr:DUF3786 domain-containing protein [Desulfotomaculum sp.]
MNLTTALLIARESFGRCIPSVVAPKAGVYADPEGRLAVPFYGREYRIPVRQGEEMPVPVEILLLHYLTRASGVLPGGEKVSFKELPDGFIYNEPFTNRVLRPLVAAFGEQPQLLYQAGAAAGGKPVPFGDAAVEIRALPRVPLTFIIWAGDEEFGPSGGVLFDATAPAYLSTEDCVIVAQMGVSVLRALSWESRVESR